MERWMHFMTLLEANIEVRQYLTTSYPMPYWCSEPYLGKGHRITSPDWHRHSIASIFLMDSSPCILYQHYEVIPQYMLTAPKWQVGSFIFPNYHYTMDFDLDFFFDISNKWSLTDDFHDISDLTSIFWTLQTPYVSLPPLDVVELIFLLDLF